MIRCPGVADQSARAARRECWLSDWTDFMIVELDSKPGHDGIASSVNSTRNARSLRVSPRVRGVEIEHGSACLSDR